MVAALAVLTVAARAEAQNVHAEVERGQLYAGMPFALQVTAEGFAEAPEPTVEPFEIPGCRVSLVGVSPNIMRMSINGRSMTRVQFVYRYRVDAPTPGTYQVPAIAVTQGGERASSRPFALGVRDLAPTRDMAIRLGLPERPIWVGETFDITVDWYIKRNAGNHQFTVPLFDATDWVELRGPDPAATRRAQTLTFTAGDRELELPFAREDAVLDGVRYTRLRATVTATPLRAGALAVDPARVVSQLQVGQRRGFFSEPRYALFKAEDVPRTLQVKPLPAAGRPPSFANAIGSGFSIDVRASRTVVRVGEPIELTIEVRGDGRMEGLSLPDLTNPDGLPADVFAVAETPATGQIADDGRSKQFRVTVRLRSPDVREIPPIAFSYFDPTRGAYETARSQPVALSVEGSAVVGAGDVVSGTRTAPASGDPATARGPAPGPAIGAAVGADLSISRGARTLRTVWTTGDVRPLLYALYALPLLILGVRLWRVRTSGRRDHRGDVRRGLRAVERELEAAAGEPARDAGPRVVAALRALARTLERPDLADAGVIARIETEAFDPRAAAEPLDAGVRDEVRALARQWADGARGAAGDRARRGPRRGSARGGAAAGLALVGAALAAAGSVRAADTGDRLAQAREAYQEALGRTDRDARTRAFARAEQLYRALAEELPDRPELLADWGNAAVGAHDLGRAALAYRRALAVDPQLERARRNLSWLRDQSPEWMRPRQAAGATEALLFWHYQWSLPARHVVGAVAFAVAVLLLVPWGVRRQRLLRWLAIGPAVVWVAMAASVALVREPVHDAVVVVDGMALRSADSPGAAPRVAEVPAGAEVTVLETRGAWTRVALAGGATDGWVQTSAIARVLSD